MTSHVIFIQMKKFSFSFFNNMPLQLQKAGDSSLKQVFVKFCKFSVYHPTLVYNFLTLL